MKIMKGYLPTLILIFLVSLGALIIIYKNKVPEPKPEPPVIKNATTRKTLTKEEEAKKIAEQDMYDFKTRFYKRYPQFQKEVELEKISHVFSFKTNVTTENDRSGVGWIIEIKNPAKWTDYTYYLLIPGIEKKMDDLFGRDEVADMSCTIESVKSYPFRNTTVGPIIISGGCSGYGKGSPITALYKFNGEKIRLIDRQSNGNIVSSSGNALGIFSRIYGADASKILIEYSNSTGYIMASSIGLFDIQTGELKYFVH